MPDTVEVLRVEYEKARAQQAATEYRAELAKVEQEIRDLKAAMDAGTLGADAYEAQTRQLGLEQARLRYELARTEEGLGQASSKVAGFGQSALQTGRVVQDFAQGGIGGILNNIEGLTQALGGTAGLAGILTLVGVGFALLRPHIERFIESLTTGDVEEFTESVEGLTERIKELTDKPIKLALDLFDLEVAKNRLDAIQKAQAAFDAASQKSRLERESGQKVAELLAEAPGGEAAIRDRLKGRVLADLEANTGSTIGQARAAADKARAEFEDLSRRYKAGEFAGTEGDTYAVVRDAQKELDKANQALSTARAEAAAPKGPAEQAVGEIFLGAKGGDVARQRQLAEQLRGIGREDVAEQIAGASPQALGAQEAKKKAEEEAKKKAEEAEKAAKEAAARLEKAGKDVGDFFDKAQDTIKVTADKAERASREAERQEAVDRKALEKATEPFAAEAELEIYRGARAQFRLPRERAAFQQQTADAIRREAEANLLAGGEAPGRARELAARAPQQLSEGLQRKFLAQQARGLSIQEADQALLAQVLGNVGQHDARLARLEQNHRELVRRQQQVVRTSQNRAR